MNIQKCKTLLKEDYKRLPIRSKNKFKNLILNGVFSESFNVTLWFRLGNYFIEQKGIVNKILGAFCRLMLLHKGHKYGISLKLGNQIGGGIFIHHYSCIIISPCAVIGRNFTVYQGVTIGRVHEGKKAGVPIIGDNVTIFAGAKVIGNIRIGNNVTVGANSVVTSDVPDNAIVAGVPARILRIKNINK